MEAAATYRCQPIFRNSLEEDSFAVVSRLPRIRLWLIFSLSISISEKILLLIFLEGVTAFVISSSSSAISNLSLAALTSA
jgi:hypothetical protein